jgi:hypothetical protein
LHWLPMKIKLTQNEMNMSMLASVKKADTHNGLLPLKYDAPSYMAQLAQMAESIAAEWVVAKYFELPFDPFEDKYKVKADVGAAIEVRWTKYELGQLIVYESDRVNDIAVLVTGEAPNFYIAGWIPVSMAQRPKYRHSKQPTWWVTQINLQPIENLRRSNYGHSAI